MKSLRCGRHQPNPQHFFAEQQNVWMTRRTR